MSATLVALTGGTWRKISTMPRTMPAAAAKRGICQRESFNTDGIIADVAYSFAMNQVIEGKAYLTEPVLRMSK